MYVCSEEKPLILDAYSYIGFCCGWREIAQANNCYNNQAHKITNKMIKWMKNINYENQLSSIFQEHFLI